MNEQDKKALQAAVDKWIREKTELTTSEYFFQAALEYARRQVVLVEKCAWSNEYGPVLCPRGDEKNYDGRLYRMDAMLAKGAGKEASCSGCEHLELIDIQNNNLRRTIQKMMARLTAILDEDQFAEMECLARQVEVGPPTQTQPAVVQRLNEEQIERGAKKLAELFDYPWEFMPDNGKHEMRGHVQSVFEAALKAVKGE